MIKFRTGLFFIGGVALLASLMLLPTGQAQPLVQNPAYDVMLKGLLDFSVPVIGVSQIEDTERYVFLDAREKAEFEISHIEKARHIGYDHFDLKTVEDLPKETPIIVYCSIGYRSEKIGEQLVQAGFSNVSNLYGSIFEWVNQGKPLFDKEGPTSKVHAYSKTWGIWLTEGEKVYE
ncbi:MAG: rhodanese-like domain-containing protein [Bacteroidota bacterium]